MCIIVMKPKGVNMPNEQILFNCWKNNYHGAGISIVDEYNNTIVTKKGFMNFEDLCSYLEEMERVFCLKDSAVLMHFRLVSVGKICKEQCHPFPISKKFKDTEKTIYESNKVFAHNGTLLIKTKKEMSDTQTFAYKYIPYLNKKELHDIIYEYGYNKLCILKNNGKFDLVGKFIKDNKIYYSNGSYSY